MGETRDRKTIDYAVAFAETGHLCLATLHANSTNQAIDRIIDFSPKNVATQLLMDLSLNLHALRLGLAAPAAEKGWQGARCHHRDTAQLLTGLRSHLQGRSTRNQGDHEKIPRAQHADLRPGAL